MQQRSLTYRGQLAYDQYLYHADLILEEGIVGNVKGYQGLFDVVGEFIRSINDPRLLNPLGHFDVVVISYKEENGDAWMYLFFPTAQKATFVEEFFE